MLVDFFHVKKKHTLPFIDKSEDLDGLRIIRLKGSIDMTTIPAIEKIWNSREKYGLIDKNLLLDFKNVEHVDSSTIAALIRALSEIKHEHRKLVLVNINDKLKDLLTILNLNNFFCVYDSEGKAVKDLVND